MMTALSSLAVACALLSQGPAETFRQVVVSSTEAVSFKLTAAEVVNGITRESAKAHFPTTRYAWKEVDGVLCLVDLESKHLSDIVNSTTVYRWLAERKLDGSPLAISDAPAEVALAIKNLLAPVARAATDSGLDTFHFAVSSSTSMTLANGTHEHRVEDHHMPDMETYRSRRQALTSHAMEIKTQTNPGQMPTGRPNTNPRQQTISAVLSGSRESLSNDMAQAALFYAELSQKLYSELQSAKANALPALGAGAATRHDNYRLKSGKWDDLPESNRSILEAQVSPKFRTPEEMAAFLSSAKVRDVNSHVWIHVVTRDGTRATNIAVGLL